MRKIHYYLISAGLGAAIGCIPHLPNFKSISLSNSVQPGFPAHLTNPQKRNASGAINLGSAIKPQKANGKFSHPKHSESADSLASLTLFKSSPSNIFYRTHIRANSEQKIELPRGISFSLTPAKSEEYIPNLQKSSSERILLSNSIQANFPIRNANLKERNASGEINLGNAVESKDANSKLSYPDRSELAGAFLSSTLFETLLSNNSDGVHINAIPEQKIELPRGIAFSLTLDESDGHVLNLPKSSSESILLPNSIQPSFLVPTTDIQEWNALQLEFFGNTQQSQKLSNNAVLLEVKGREESASFLAQLDQSSPGNLPQQTPADITELDPKPNPLLRPSFPEEVQINRTVPITLQQTLQLARRNNRQLQVAELELRRSRLGLREIQSALYPTVAIEAGLNRDLSGQGQLSVESQQRQFAEQNRESQQQISQLQADLDALRNSPAPDPAIDPAGFVQRELTLSQFQSELVQAQNSVVQTQNSRSSLENFATTTLSGGVTLNYDLFTSGRRSANIRAAEEEVRFNELELESVAEQLRLDVTDTYYNLQDADQQVRIEEDAVRRATIILRDAILLKEAQLATRLDEVNARVESENARQRLVRAQSQQQTARRELARLLSIPSVIDVLAADPVQQVGVWELSLPESIVLALQNRAELEQQLVQRNISEQRRRSALAALGPTVSVFASYNMLRLSNDDPSEFASRGFADGYSLGARVRWDLFDGGAAKARAGQEEVNRAIAETRFADVSKQVRLEVERAYNNLTSNQRNIQTATLSLEGAREALRLARSRFQAGVGPLSDVITAESNVTEAEGNRIRAILGYNRALAALQRAISNFPGNRLNRVI